MSGLIKSFFLNHSQKGRDKGKSLEGGEGVMEYPEHQRGIRGQKRLVSR